MVKKELKELKEKIGGLIYGELYIKGKINYKKMCKTIYNELDINLMISIEDYVSHELKTKYKNYDFQIEFIPDTTCNILIDWAGYKRLSYPKKIYYTYKNEKYMIKWISRKD